MHALLIRHPQVPLRDQVGLRSEMGLSAEGERAAQALAKRLERVGLAAIFSSRLRRTMQTAEAIAAGRGLAVTVEPALIEVNPGQWDGRRFQDLADDPRWKMFHAFRSGTRIPGGEMMIEVQCRVVAFLEKIAREFSGRTVAVVSHADVIRSAICHFTGIPLDLSLRVEIGLGSLSILQIEEWGARLICLNDSGELPPNL